MEFCSGGLNGIKGTVIGSEVKSLLIKNITEDLFNKLGHVSFRTFA
jgi:hypothetical protein